ncbi:hypothetical protein [Streptomyces sp. NPDC051546]|uniref:hypothetical protein n=1 Tax=Streptomyces sp. NPDC051546 TaxID=3365655 RepID=UPI00379EB67E
MLKHPRIAGVVETLVAVGGGRITYDTGGGGREMLLAAGARLAAETNTPLTIVEARHLHSEVRAFVRELQPTVSSAVISAQEAALQPAGSTSGVLAVHADVLRDADVRQPLLTMAHSADHLVVARHDDSDTTLDALATPGLVLRLRDLMPPAPRPNPLAARWTAPEMEERKQRLLRQLNGGVLPERDMTSFEEMALAMQQVDPEEVQQRIAQMRQKYEGLVGQQQPADPPASRPRAARDHGQAQSAAHQQQGHQGLGRT